MKCKNLSAENILLIHKTIVKQYKLADGHAHDGSISSLLLKIDLLDNDSVNKNAAIFLEGLIRLHPFTDGNKRTALQVVKDYFNHNDYAIEFPISVTALTYKIASNIENDPKSNEDLIEYIEGWLSNFSVNLNQHSLRKTQMVYLLYYRLPIKLLKLCRKLHQEKISYWIVKRYLHKDIPDLNEDILLMVSDMMVNHIKISSKN